MIYLFIGLFVGFTFAAMLAGCALHRRDLAEPVEVVRLVETDRVEVWRDERLVYAGPDRRGSRVEDDEAYRWGDVGRRAGEGDEELDAVRCPVSDAVPVSDAQREAARLIALEADPWGQHK